MRINLAKLIIANLLIAAILFMLAELAARAFWTTRTCLRDGCDYSTLVNLKISNERTRKYGFSRYDKNLGHAPKEGFDGVVDIPEWRNARVTINEQGFRSNDKHESINSDNKTLAVGDSFTFGDQVSNNETWASCLERKTATKFDNGGVFAYGAAQAVKRGVELTERSAAEPYSRIILSILVGVDFARDRLSYNSGFPRPAVVKKNGEVGWDAVPDPKTLGTRYNPKQPNAVALFLFQRSLLANRLLDKLNFDAFGDLLTTEHPAAASRDEIAYWTLDKFAEINVPEKVIVLQYYSDLSSKSVLEERQFLLKALSKYPFRHIDTFELFSGKDPLIYWNGHHTPAGNALVCNAISEKIK
ncbi:MAG: hypothetical protein HYS06_08330 [Methylocystis sp.]|nr:hypothetical protein [Methylocystis sp.]